MTERDIVTSLVESGAQDWRVALLGVLALQVASGMVADDEIASSGPLVNDVASSTSAGVAAVARLGD